MQLVLLDYSYNGEQWTTTVLAYSIDNAIRWLYSQLGKVDIRSQSVLARVDGITPECAIQVIDGNKTLYDRVTVDRQREVDAMAAPTTSYTAITDDVRNDPYRAELTMRKQRESKQASGWRQRG